MRLVVAGRSKWAVLVVAKEDGSSLLDELESNSVHDVNARAMLAMLELAIPATGKPSTTRHCKSLGDGLYEFRTHGWRVFAFYDKNAMLPRLDKNGKVVKYGGLVETPSFVCSHFIRKQGRKSDVKNAKERCSGVRKTYETGKSLNAVEFKDRANRDEQA